MVVGQPRNGSFPRVVVPGVAVPVLSPYRFYHLKFASCHVHVIDYMHLLTLSFRRMNRNVAFTIFFSVERTVQTLWRSMGVLPLF